jgi:serine/threonine-protein kinase MRCK
LLFLQNNDLQLKLTRSRNRSMMELDQGLQEKSEKFEKEKLALKEKNKELRLELDKVQGMLIIMHSPHTIYA